MKLAQVLKEVRNNGTIINPFYRWHGRQRAIDDLVKILLYTSDYQVEALGEGIQN